MNMRPTTRWYHRWFYRLSSPYRYDVEQALNAMLHTGIGIGMRRILGKATGVLFADDMPMPLVYCDQCGTQVLLADALYCRQCGTRLPLTGPQVPVQPQQTPATPLQRPCLTHWQRISQTVKAETHHLPALTPGVLETLRRQRKEDE